MELRKGRHCVFMLHAHLIFITKYRGKVFNSAQLTTMRGIMAGVCEKNVALSLPALKGRGFPRLIGD